MRAARLDRVVLLPEPEPRGKQCASLGHRLAMLELAIAGRSGLSVLRPGSRRFTVAQTLPELREAFPGDELTLLVGSDVVRGIASWPGAAQLLAQLRLVVGLRGADTAASVAKSLHSIPEARFTVVASPHPHAASSVIRRGVPRLVLEPVAAYISQNQLYMSNT